MIGVRCVHLESMKLGKRRFRKDRVVELGPEAFDAWIATRDGVINVAQLAVRSGALELTIGGKPVTLEEALAARAGTPPAAPAEPTEPEPEGA